MINSLSKAEWAVMSALWENPHQTVSGVIKTMDNMGEKTGWKYNTYATYIKRMCDKGLVAYDWMGRDKMYYPAVQKQECVQAESEGILDKIDNKATKEFLLCMIKSSELNTEDRQELMDLLQQLSKEGDA